jgi:hypothetical protein
MRRWVALVAGLLTSIAVVAMPVTDDVALVTEPAPTTTLTVAAEPEAVFEVAGVEEPVTKVEAQAVPVPETAPRHRPRSCPEFEEKFRSYGLEPVRKFSFIAWRETRCNPGLINATFDAAGRPVKTLNRDGSYDVGLLQINSTWKKVTHEICGTPYGDMFALLDLHCNLSVARYLLENGGLGHWSL